MTRPRIIHADISDYAHWRSVCGATPTEGGTNLSLADEQVTCKKCLRKMGYAV